MSKTNEQWILKSRPKGAPTTENFEVKEVEIPELQDGEFLVQVEYISVDPYVRGRLRETINPRYAKVLQIGDVIIGGGVGIVAESKSETYPEGTRVVHFMGWQRYVVLNESSRPVKLPDFPENVPSSYALGILGMPGYTAYFGLTDVASLQKGDIVVVSAAAGAVGSVVVQIAKKLYDCTVVGIAGSDEKCSYVTDVLGADACINYKTSTVKDGKLKAALEEALPDGWDVYFDNVGGPISDTLMPMMRLRARIAVCGVVSQYNNTVTGTGTADVDDKSNDNDSSSSSSSSTTGDDVSGANSLYQPRFGGLIVTNRARIQGFIVSDYFRRLSEADKVLQKNVLSGDFKYSETVAEGFESVPQAFIDLLAGANTGKMVVKL